MEEKKKVNTQLISLIISIILLVEGLFLLLFPKAALPYMIIIPAIGLLAYGIISFIVFTLKKNKEGITKKTYVFPVISIIAGALLLIFAKESGYLLPYVIGAWIIISSCIMLKKASEMLSLKVLARLLGGLSLGSGIALVILGITWGVYDRVLMLGIVFFIFGILSVFYQTVFNIINSKKQPRVK